ncbi:MAG: iron complex outermembrane receptor protein [Porticoccus sp.]
MKKIANLMAFSITAASVPTVMADHYPEIETVEVTANAFKEFKGINLDLTSSPDASALLRQVPGASFNTNGPLTTLPQYRGMVSQRLSIAVDGHQTISGGPNLMDPPLQYAPAALLSELTVTRGIAPISAAPQTIGGHIEATLWEGEFSKNNNTTTTGRVVAGLQSVDSSYQIAAMAAAANKNHKIAISLLQEQGDDAQFDGGEITPTEYERQRTGIQYSWQTEQQEFNIRYSNNKTDDAGTAVLPMDIQYIDSEVVNLDYLIHLDNWRISANFTDTDVEHSMSNFHLRAAPMPARWRANLATAEGTSFGLQAESTDETGGWTLGIDSSKESHDSDISNPNNGMFFVRNFNNSQQEILSAYTERQQVINEKTKLTAGIRANKITVDADEVGSSMAMMMPMVATLQNDFNNTDREQTFNNIDAMARLNYQASETLSYTAAVSHKSRAPVYQELYLWLPLQATAGLADGKNYIGNVNLDSETSDEIELGVDLIGDKFFIAPRIFYRNIDDYIQGTPSTNMAANMVSNMMAGDPNPLQFNNVDAVMYGFDIEWQYLISDQWQLQGTVNYVRGELRNGDDDLYRIAPPSARISANYSHSNWNMSLTGMAFAKQDNVASVNDEIETSGYALFDLTGGIQLSANLSINAGVNNVFDRQYNDHLAGVNRAGGSDVGVGERIPGYGRNLFARAVWAW